MQVDIFSSAVILFTMVLGIFPFKEAVDTDYFYTLITYGETDTYWEKIGNSKLSPQFKDLFIKMVNENGKERPTIAQIRDHPWMKIK